MNLDDALWIWHIHGINPVPWKAPKPTIGRRAGKLTPMVHSQPEVIAYQETLREHIETTFTLPVHDGPIDMVMFFWRQLEGRANRVDATNLQKSTEDALHALLFVNDRQVIDVRSKIMKQSKGTEPFILIVAQPHEDGPDDEWAEEQRSAFMHNLKPPKKQAPHLEHPEDIF